MGNVASVKSFFSSGNGDDINAPITYGFVPTPPDNNVNVNIARGLGISPPMRPTDENDSGKINAYYRAGNICWLLGLLLAIIFCAVIGGVFDAGLTSSWSSQGSKRLNDRHLPISSVHSLNLDLGHPTFVVNWTNSTTITPAVWDGLVFYASWDGKIAALQEHTGEVAWMISICVDVYALTPSVCSGHVLDGYYITVATPTVWGENIVLSIRKPADIVVLNQKTGVLVKKATLTTNSRASLTQSGTVWDNYLIIGSSISETDAEYDSEECSFIGQVWRWDLDENRAVWVTSMEDPNGDHSSVPSGFTGMPIRGSSPALSVKHGLVTVSTGPLVCRPSWYQACIDTSNCNALNFDYVAYERQYENCHNAGTATYALFNSVVALRLEDGSLYWHEKLIGARAWSLSCEGYNLTNPCRDYVENVEDCDFARNPYANCPTEIESCNNAYEFVDDPALQIHSNGDETLYAMQHSGIIFSFDMVKRGDGDDQVLWAMAVSRGKGAGGIAVDKTAVYFSVFNEEGKLWNYGNNNVTTECGGWGAIKTSDGLPIWYSPHPICNGVHSDCSGNLLVNPGNTGGQSAPSVTNDLVIVTSDDTSRLWSANWDESNHHCGGNVYALHTSNGELVTSYDTGEPFGEQGVSIHGRCIYAGHGPNPLKLKASGKKMYGWCVDQAFVMEEHHHEETD